MKPVLTALLRNTRGATTIEYALICGMIVMVILGAIRGLGGENGGVWGSVASKTTTAMNNVAN